jgi:hypothetical protein
MKTFETVNEFLFISYLLYNVVKIPIVVRFGYYIFYGRALESVVYISTLVTTSYVKLSRMAYLIVFVGGMK